MKQKPRITFLGAMVVLAIIGIVAGIVTMANSLSEVSVMVFGREDLLQDAKVIADDLGDTTAEGRVDDEWDDGDHKEMCKAMGILASTPLDDISAIRLKGFIDQHSSPQSE